jgi:hypothetical protein
MTTIAERTGKLYDLITDITCESYDNNRKYSEVL